MNVKTNVCTWMNSADWPNGDAPAAPMCNGESVLVKFFVRDGRLCAETKTVVYGAGGGGGATRPHVPLGNDPAYPLHIPATHWTGNGGGGGTLERTHYGLTKREVFALEMLKAAASGSAQPSVADAVQLADRLLYALSMDW
jgi:hypothetical protein